MGGNNTIVIFAVLSILIIGGIGVLAFFAIKLIKKTDPGAGDTSIKNDIETAQEFLPFQDVKDGIMDLGGFRYRMYIECGSVNYNLKTETERDMVEIAFQKLVNSLTFPLTFYIQTRVIDNTYILREIEKDVTKTSEKYPHLSQHAAMYYKNMQELNAYLPSNKQKKKYIIVSFEEATELDGMSDSEKYSYSVSELKNRVRIVTELLKSMQIPQKILDTKGIVEVVYAAYHKDNFSIDKIEDIVNGEFFTLLTKGNNPEEGLTYEMRVDYLLEDLQKRLDSEFLNNYNTPESIRNLCERLYEAAESMRNNTGGYFKSKKTNTGFKSLSDVLGEDIGMDKKTEVKEEIKIKEQPQVELQIESEIETVQSDVYADSYEYTEVTSCENDTDNNDDSYYNEENYYKNEEEYEYSEEYQSEPVGDISIPEVEEIPVKQGVKKTTRFIQRNNSENINKEQVENNFTESDESNQDVKPSFNRTRDLSMFDK